MNQKKKNDKKRKDYEDRNSPFIIHHSSLIENYVIFKTKYYNLRAIDYTNFINIS